MSRFQHCVPQQHRDDAPDTFASLKVGTGMQVFYKSKSLAQQKKRPTKRAQMKWEVKGKNEI